MIIGITGKKGSGKDTIGTYLVENYGFIRLAFADKIKEVLAALLDVDVEWVEKYKNDDSIKLMIHQINELFIKIKPLTIRGALKRIGTECGRDILGEDVWINPVHRYIQQNPGDYVITDVRFENEGLWVWENTGEIIKVVRPSTEDGDDHRSELGISEYDIEIINDRGLDDLYAAVDNFMSFKLEREKVGR